MSPPAHGFQQVSKTRSFLPGEGQGISVRGNRGEILYRAHNRSLLRGIILSLWVRSGLLHTLSSSGFALTLFFIPFLISESLPVWPMPFRNDHYN